MVTPSQFEVYWVDLNPTVGSEISKLRPCVIVSPNEINRHLNTVIIVPATSTLRSYPFRTRCHIEGKEGDLAVDQIRTIDKSRLIKKISNLKNSEITALKTILANMFK